MALTDAQLVARALTDDEEACRELVSRYQRAVYNLLARMLRDPALAEDLAQETFVRALGHLGTFDTRYKFSNWLLRIAHNLAIDAIRRRGLDLVPLEGEEGRPGPADIVPARGGEDGLERVERLDLGEALESATASLRPEYRHVVVLRYQEELSYEEIADITGLPLGTVKSYLHRARAQMAARLTAAGWKPAGR